MKKIKKINLFAKLFIICLIVYTAIIFIDQQKTLNSYNNEKNYLSLKIQEKKDNNKVLNSTKENINSLDYIEKMARDKLDMYLPNERVYIDM